MTSSDPDVKRCYCAAHNLEIACDPGVGPCQQMAVLDGPDRSAADRLRERIDAIPLEDR